ncbi:hypothetical protein IKO50_01845 [bacterium]|nr:hypothetical protein [bacterium]MBO7504940.1 hypothetical protein [bacterium]MBR4633720.1 hypothetical protein [bacterium]
MVQDGDVMIFKFNV